MTRLAKIFSVLLVLVLLPSLVWAQAGNSTVRGAVRDQTQAAVPGASVTLTNVGTNLSRSSVTNEVGMFSYPTVFPGQYHITVESAGMQKFEGQLTVTTGQDASLDVVLQVGQAATSVEVRDVTQLLVTDNAALTSTLERQRIEQLPILGRGYQNLLQTVPGLVFSNHGHQNGGRALGYGLQIGSTMLTMDGNPLTEDHGGWDVARLPDLDAIQELHVETNNSSAKYSRPTTLVMSSRAGTNAFHGAVFYNNRNSGYGVARQRQDTFTKPPYVNRNEYGASAGGPVYIPKVYNGKNRTFWFYSWEGTRSRIGTTVQFATPTAAMKAGDFTGLIDSQGRLQKLYDPMTTNATTWARAPLSYNNVVNTIDPARISAPAKFLFPLAKLPTLPINPLIDNNFAGVGMRPLTQDAHSVRIDHRVSDKDLIYGRFGYDTHWEALNSGSSFARWEPIFGDQPIGRYQRIWPNKQLSFTWLRTVSATITNELNTTGTRDTATGGSGYNNGWPVDYAATMGLPNPFGAHNWPAFNSIGPGNWQAEVAFNPYINFSNYLTFQDNITQVVRKHELSYGYQFRLYDLPRAEPQTTAGPFDSSTQATSLYDPSTGTVNPGATAQTGANIANLYLGVLNYGTTFQRPTAMLRRYEHALYLQDNWKVTPRLTLNLGLRWEIRTPLTDHNGLNISFDYDKHAYALQSDVATFIKKGGTLPSIIQAFTNFGGKIETFQEAGLPSGMVNMNWKMFGPRLGFAYRALEGKKAFVLRGGFRISYYPGTTGTVYNAINGPQLVSASFTNSVTNTALSPDGIQNYGLRSVPTYIAGKNTPDSIININETRLQARGDFTGTRLNPNLPDQKVYDWNMTFEKEVLPDTVFRFAYLGNNTVNIPVTVNMNSAVPSYIWYATTKTATPTGTYANVAMRPYDQQVYGNLSWTKPLGFSWYNGIEMGIERRFSRGYAFQFFYDMANSLKATGTVTGLEQFMPGAVPTDEAARARFLNYQRESLPPSSGTGVGTPKHRIRWNWVADIPFGRGKKLGANVPKLVDGFIGGWQIAGNGYIVSRYMTLSTSWYPNNNKLETYGYQHPVTDCRSGICYPGYLWYNGYIPSYQINSHDANGKPNGIMGVPDNYQAASAPLIPYGQTALPANAPSNTVMSSYWDSNTIWVPLANGSVQRTTYNNNLNPWRNQILYGPMQWFQDASLFKFINITEKVKLRFNVDVFNAFNHPNNPASVDSAGVLLVRNSDNTARLMQLALRLNW